jgi:GTPase SAR1 family protein
MPFAQLVVGPPGAGKSTYCNGMQQFMGTIGRKASIVNLDPANDRTSYDPAVDVRSLVTLEEIMKDDELGPNGGVLYALEELEHNMDWLEDKLKALGEDYLLFDCPGQVELFTHHDSLRKIFFAIQKMGYRVCSQDPVSTPTRAMVTVTDGAAASSSQSYRFIRPHPSFIVPLDPPAIITHNAANGSNPYQRSDQD